MTGRHTARWTDWSCSVRVTTVDARDLGVLEPLVRGLMGDVERAVSRFRPDSDLSRVNAAAGHLVPVRPLTLDLVDVALASARHTHGAVDPLLAADLEALGYDADLAVVRRRVVPLHLGGGAREGREAGAWRRVRTDHRVGLVGVPSGHGLDLGATAKAWTVDEAVRRGATQLRAPFLVSIGGDLAVHGAPDGGWQLSVEEVEGSGGSTVSLTSGGLATSSTTGRRWAGVHHLLDPRTGRSASGRYRTASVWAPSCLTANTRSTWLLVDADAATAAPGLPTRLVDSRGGVHVRDGWPEESPAPTTHEARAQQPRHEQQEAEVAS
ncbi:FAD:protein FMN transferase [Nocardioides sp. GY 10127]|uniref:FAD:protein FMN transferase n=1 Tax=Nocardioides sp. GY 10127 TaxID=2569762 RepID=UPI0010A847E6|nr:FAD:protein FMN transferase [Nocardioides sp. GY 10127]TIC79323.1 FAD:protein FMN transferase [Nocardioides sp. GY 10127]